MPRPAFKTNVPQMKIKKPNYQNLMIIVVFVVGGFLIYRMISSVQRQLLLLKQDVSNLKDDVKKPQQTPGSAGGTPVGFEVSFQEAIEDDEVSIDSVDIDKIMKKLTAPKEEESTVKGGMDFSELTSDDRGVVADNEPALSDDTGEDSDEEGETEDESRETAENPIDDEVDVTEKIIEIDSNLSKKSLAELKKMLKDRGLSTKGNKSRLIETLSENL